MKSPLNMWQLFTFFVSACMLAGLYSCAPKVPVARPPERPARIEIGHVSRQIHERGLLFRQGTMKGKGWLFLPDGHKQKVRFLLQWSFEKGSPMVRAAGFGPFGITIFDFLAFGNNAYLMVPSRSVTYSARAEDIKGSRAASAAARQFAQLVNPWFKVDNIEIHSSSKTVVDGTYTIDGARWRVVFDPATFMPVRLTGPEIIVEYGHEAIEAAGKAILYPKSMNIEIKDRPISLRLQIKSVKAAASGLDERVFDKSRFTQFQIRPWKELFECQGL